ncbi:MAG: type II toxin-antitoxin system VapC family toxin [Candidatus Binatia bacterium]
MTATGLLLDTHVFLWWRANDPQLGGEATRAIAEAEFVFVSAASAWEAAIKMRLGRLEIPEPIAAGVRDSGFEQLPIRFSHAETAGSLPEHHRDPFDRMLLAQALIEGLTLVTADRRMEPYGVPILWS